MRSFLTEANLQATGLTDFSFSGGKKALVFSRMEGEPFVTAEVADQSCKNWGLAGTRGRGDAIEPSRLACDMGNFGSDRQRTNIAYN